MKATLFGVDEVDLSDAVDAHSRAVSTLQFLTHRFGGFWLKRVLVALYRFLITVSKGDANSALEAMTGDAVCGGTLGGCESDKL